MRAFLLIGACTWSLAQDTIGADVRVRGDFVEVDVWWRSGVGYVPVAANFVLVWPQAAALVWPQVAITQGGLWDAAQSPLYRSLYITQKPEYTAQRVSLNLIPQDPSQGLAIPAQRTFVGRYRVPIQQFGATLQPQWGMESGEIVGLARQGEKGRFVYAPLSAITLCPSVAGYQVRYQYGELTLEAPAEFRPNSLTIDWYHNGQFVGQGPQYTPSPGTAGLYYAHITHICGSVAWSDTLVLTTTQADIVSHGAWHVYPLPAREALYVIPPQQGPCRYELSDLSGRRLLSGRWEAAASPHALDLSTLPAGSYLLRLEQNTTQTFLISHAW